MFTYYVQSQGAGNADNVIFSQSLCLNMLTEIGSKISKILLIWTVPYSNEIQIKISQNLLGTCWPNILKERAFQGQRGDHIGFFCIFGHDKAQKQKFQIKSAGILNAKFQVPTM